MLREILRMVFCQPKVGNGPGPVCCLFYLSPLLISQFTGSRPTDCYVHTFSAMCIGDIFQPSFDMPSLDMP